MSSILWIALAVIAAVILDVRFVRWLKRRRNNASNVEEDPESIASPSQSRVATSVDTPPATESSATAQATPPTATLAAALLIAALAQAAFASERPALALIGYVVAGILLVKALRPLVPQTQTDNESRVTAIPHQSHFRGNQPTAVLPPTAPAASDNTKVTFWTHWRLYTLADILSGKQPAPPAIEAPPSAEAFIESPSTETPLPVAPLSAALDSAAPRRIWTGGESPFIEPKGIAFTPQGHTLVLDTGRMAVYRLDSDGAVVELIPTPDLPKQPINPIVSPDGKTLFVINEESKKIRVIPLTPMADTTPAPANEPAATPPPPPTLLATESHSTPEAIRSPALALDKLRSAWIGFVHPIGRRLVLPHVHPAIVALLIGVIALLLFVGEWIVVGPIWWTADLSAFAPLEPLSCFFPPFCEFEFPRLFGLVVLLLATGGTLGAWLSHQPLAKTAPIENSDVPFSGDTRWYVIGLVLSAFAAAGWGSARWPLAIALTVLAAGALWRSWRIGWPPNSLFGDAAHRIVLLGLALFTLAASAYGLRSWRWAAYGDDYTFFYHSTGILKGNVPPIPWGVGVDEFYAVGHTLAQAATMIAFGIDGYGWRIGSSISLAITVPGIWLLARLFFSRPTALLTAGFFAGSHLLMSYSKIGYNHAYAFIPFVWAPVLVGWGIRRDRVWLVAAGGAVAGLGFYTLALARLAILPTLWLLLLYLPPHWRRRRTLQMWGAVLAAFIVVTAPLLLNFSNWQVLWTRATLGTRLMEERALHPEPNIDTATYVFRNVLYGLFSWLWSGNNSHWVFGAHLDPLSAMMAALGLPLLIGGRLPVASHSNGGDWRIRLWVLGTSVGAVAAAAGANPYPWPSNNRMFVLVPIYALWAGIGATQLARWIVWLAGKPRLQAITHGGLIAGACVLGIYQMRFLTPGRMPIPLPVNLALRIIQEERPKSKVCFMGRDGYNLEIPRSFYVAFHLTPEQWEVTNQAPPPLDDPSCGIVLLDIGLPDLADLGQQLRQRHPRLVESEGRDEAGVAQFMRYDLNP